MYEAKGSRSFRLWYLGGNVARFYPNTLNSSAPLSEKRVFEALRKLSNDWIVVHGLRFVTPAHGKRPPRNGEADFVLMHPRHGLVVLEAKGGRYEIEHGSWHTFPGGERTRMDASPFEQATRNRYDLRDHVSEQTGIRGLPIGHAVVFTDGAPRGNLGPAAPAAIVVDGIELADLPAAVRRICAHWFPGGARRLHEAQFEQVLAVLAPTATVAADRQYSVDVTLADVQQRTEREIVWTSEQLEVIAATQPGGPYRCSARPVPVRQSSPRAAPPSSRTRVCVSCSSPTSDTCMAPSWNSRRCGTPTSSSGPRKRWRASSARTCRR